MPSKAALNPHKEVVLSNVSSAPRKVGTLHNQDVYQYPDGSLAIERELDRLCEMTITEYKLFFSQHFSYFFPRDETLALNLRQSKLSCERERAARDGVKWPYRIAKADPAHARRSA